MDVFVWQRAEHRALGCSYAHSLCAWCPDTKCDCLGFLCEEVWGWRVFLPVCFGWLGLVAIQGVKVHVQLILLTGIFNLSLAKIDPMFQKLPVCIFVPKSDTEYQMSFQNGSQIRRHQPNGSKFKYRANVVINHQPKSVDWNSSRRCTASGLQRTWTLTKPNGPTGPLWTWNDALYPRQWTSSCYPPNQECYQSMIRCRLQVSCVLDQPSRLWEAPDYVNRNKE